MKSSHVLFVAFAIMLAILSVHGKAKDGSTQPRSDDAKMSDLGRKVNYGGSAINHGIDDTKFAASFHINDVDDDDVNESFNKSGSDTDTQNHHIFTGSKNKP